MLQNVFDTEVYERILTGREFLTIEAAGLEVDSPPQNKLEVGSAAEVLESALAGCSLCSFLYGDLVPSDSEKIRVSINLIPCHFPLKPCTSVGKTYSGFG